MLNRFEFFLYLVRISNQTEHQGFGSVRFEIRKVRPITTIDYSKTFN